MSEAFSFGQIGDALMLAGMGSLAPAPTVLLAATDRWYPTARLGMALADAGCIVDAVCPSSHPVRLTRAQSDRIQMPLLAAAWLALTSITAGYSLTATNQNLIVT